MPDLLHRDAPATIVGHDVDARTVMVRLCRWNDPRAVVDDGVRYREQYPPGSIELAADVGAVDRHDGVLVGRALPDTLRDDGDGPVVDIRLARSAPANDLLALIDDDVIRAVSMELDPVSSTRAGDLLTRTRSIVHNIAFAFRPAHDSPILATREQPEGQTAMPTDTVTPADLVDDTPDPGDVVTGELLTRELDEIRREIATAPALIAPASEHPLTRYRSLDDAVQASWSDPAVRDLLHRELADQITDNNPGVMPPAWVSTVYGIVDRGRPLITAFGVGDAGDEGLQIDWPYFEGNLSELVGEQVAEKTAITSVQVDLERGSADLRTYAGGSDISYQLIRRSRPAYRDAYMRIMYAAYSAVTDGAAGTMVTAGQAIVWDASTDTDGAALRRAVFAASALVDAATGQPASFVVVSSDIFTQIGGIPSLYPAQYGTSNVGGTADAATLSVSISGLPVVMDPYLNLNTAYVSNQLAGSWYEDGPYTVAAEDVERLGQNVAVWGLGVFATHLPDGIVELNPAGTPTVQATADKSTKSTKSTGSSK